MRKNTQPNELEFGVPQLNSLPAACRENGTERSVVFSASLLFTGHPKKRKSSLPCFPQERAFPRTF